VYGLDGYGLVAGCFRLAGSLKGWIFLDCPRNYHFTNDCPDLQNYLCT